MSETSDVPYQIDTGTAAVLKDHRKEFTAEFGRAGLDDVTACVEALLTRFPDDATTVRAGMDALLDAIKGDLHPVTAMQAWEESQAAERRARAALTAALVWAHKRGVPVTRLSDQTGLSRKTITIDTKAATL